MPGAALLTHAGDVDLQRLLGRDPVRVDRDKIRRNLEGKSVLITGGSGSIGRELARRIAGLKPARLAILDRNENTLYLAQMDLQKDFPRVRLDCLVGDVLDLKRVDWAMETFSPDIVFHAAAFKHVPLMELHPAEAFKNNVLGTRNVALAAAASGARRFVFVSTDKAANPIGVMGGTKRLAEMVLTDIPGGTRFVAVRFGNVLGSDGSVVPLFERQIREGGPVTITHPEATRYFMTITEAAQLVLQAGSMGDGGEVFLLDMGEPIRIVDLARYLIERLGGEDRERIEIVFTGLRPGEKLHEEPYSLGNEWLATSHERVIRYPGAHSPAGVMAEIRRLETVVKDASVAAAEEAVRKALVDLVPEFRPASGRLPGSLGGEGLAAPARLESA